MCCDSCRDGVSRHPAGDAWGEAGFDDEFNSLPIIGTDDPFTGTSMTLNGGDSADNQGFDNASFISTAVESARPAHR